MNNKVVSVKERFSLKKWILVINLMVMIFPPIHLWFTDGSMTRSLIYFYGSGVVLIVSMVILRAIDTTTVKE